MLRDLFSIVTPMLLHPPLWSEARTRSVEDFGATLFSDAVPLEPGELLLCKAGFLFLPQAAVQLRQRARSRRCQRGQDARSGLACHQYQLLSRSNAAQH